MVFYVTWIVPIDCIAHVCCSNPVYVVSMVLLIGVLAGLYTGFFSARGGGGGGRGISRMIYFVYVPLPCVH